MWDQDIYRETLQYAATVHHGQLIPDSDLPYLLHITMVASEVQKAIVLRRSYFEDPTKALQIALLHDSLEDTNVTKTDLGYQFGSFVTDSVQALTKNPQLSKEKKMGDSLDRILKLRQPEPAIVKLADRITNLQKPPRSWPVGKVFAYWEEAKVIQERLGHRCPYLQDRLGQSITDYEQYVT